MVKLRHSAARTILVKGLTVAARCAAAERVRRAASPRRRLGPSGLVLAAAFFCCAFCGTTTFGNDEQAAVLATPEPDLLPIEQEDRLVPGLILELLRSTSVDAAPSVADARHARLVTLRIDRNAHASPFVGSEPLHARWRGYLYSDVGQNVRFEFEGAGTAMLAINGVTVVERFPIAEAERSPEVQIHSGFNYLEATFQGPPETDAFVRLLWSGADFIPEPVLPTVLFHDPLDPQLLEAQQLRQGRELFATLNCLKCHSLDALAIDNGMPELGRDNPDLKTVGERLQPAWVLQWLLDPSAMRNDVAMPVAPLGRDEEQRLRTAANITAFLFAARGVSPAEPDATAAGEQLVDGGEELFEERGCVACHRLTPPAEPDEFNRVSLYYVAAKFQPGAIASFLRAPFAHYAWGRMPDLQLGQQEAAALAAYLHAKAAGICPLPEQMTNADPMRGEESFHTLGCANCHPLTEDGERLAAATLAGSMTARGCLAAAEQVPETAPGFAFTETERAALLSFCNQGFASLEHRIDVEISARYSASLRCTACHDRDGVPNLLGEVFFEESLTGRPPELVPSLTWVGEKLQRSWMEELIAGRLDRRARPWLNLRMPHFPVRAADLAAGLAAEHGVAKTETVAPPADPNQVRDGQRLTLQAPQGFFCIQCHAVGEQKALGAFDHKGINFALVGRRLRRDFYERWITDPMRIDPASKMPKLAPDGKTSNIKAVYDGDAQRQFSAIWAYLQSLSE